MCLGEFTFPLRTSISLVNTCVHFCFLDAIYKMPWLHGMHNSLFWKQVDFLVLQGSGSPTCEQINALFFFRPVVSVTLFLFVNFMVYISLSLKLWSINFYLWNHFDSSVFIFLYKYTIFLSVPAQDDKGAADTKMGTNVFYIYNK